MKSETRTELMAIPIVAIVFVVGFILARRIRGRARGPGFSSASAAVALVVLLAVRYARRNPHPAASAPPPATLAPQPADDTLPRARDRRRELRRPRLPGADSLPTRTAARSRRS